MRAWKHRIQNKITMTPIQKQIASLAAALFLGACGGGGGGGGSTAPVVSTETFQLRQAYTNDFNGTKSYPFTVSGSITAGAEIGTVTGSGTLTQSAVSATAFEGAAAQLKTRTITGNITVTTGSGSASQALTPGVTNYFANPAFDLVGYSSAGSYSVAVAPITVPAGARVGDSGTAGTINTYASAAKGAVLSTNELSWSLTADTATTAILNLMQIVKNPGGAITATQVDTYRLTPAGGSTPINSVATVLGSGALAFAY